MYLNDGYDPATGDGWEWEDGSWVLYEDDTPVARRYTCPYDNENDFDDWSADYA